MRKGRFCHFLQSSFSSLSSSLFPLLHIISGSYFQCPTRTKRPFVGACACFLGKDGPSLREGHSHDSHSSFERHCTPSLPSSPPSSSFPCTVNRQCSRLVGYKSSKLLSRRPCSDRTLGTLLSTATGAQCSYSSRHGDNPGSTFVSPYSLCSCLPILIIQDQSSSAKRLAALKALSLLFRCTGLGIPSASLFSSIASHQIRLLSLRKLSRSPSSPSHHHQNGAYQTCPNQSSSSPRCSWCCCLFQVSGHSGDFSILAVSISL